MKAFTVTDIKVFMSGLLSGNLFQGWELRSLEAGLKYHLAISGKVNRAYLTEQESAALTSDYLLWDELQPKVRALIAGGHTPTTLTLVLAAPASLTSALPQESIEAFALNLKYESVDASGQKAKPALTLITGVSAKGFSLDKTPERAWDELLPTYFASHGISISET